MSCRQTLEQFHDLGYGSLWVSGMTPERERVCVDNKYYRSTAQVSTLAFGSQIKPQKVGVHVQASNRPISSSVCWRLCRWRRSRVLYPRIKHSRDMTLRGRRWKTMATILNRRLSGVNSSALRTSTVGNQNNDKCMPVFATRTIPTPSLHASWICDRCAPSSSVDTHVPFLQPLLSQRPNTTSLTKPAVLASLRHRLLNSNRFKSATYGPTEVLRIG